MLSLVFRSAVPPYTGNKRRTPSTEIRLTAAFGIFGSLPVIIQSRLIVGVDENDAQVDREVDEGGNQADGLDGMMTMEEARFSPDCLVKV